MPFPCFGTVMTNRKNLPKITDKLKRGESKSMCILDDGIICYKWQDTKEVTLLSNCHSHVIETANRKQKDGSIKTLDCPQAITSYNQFMGGVDKADQYSTTYEVDRKSNKWWKRVFHRLLMIAVSNAWILYKQLKKADDLPLIDFLIPLAKAVTAVGKSGAKHQRKSSSGRPSKRAKLFINVGHQPIEGPTQRRCRLCAMKKIQSRTKWLCNTCDEPLCVGCFVYYHK
ncbi:hypothetical protein HA402_012658 [Bradysia odoriphaga]|nr:hypothetical protein HA402_012658 [Bradysia odoriphaga]